MNHHHFNMQINSKWAMFNIYVKLPEGNIQYTALEYLQYAANLTMWQQGFPPSQVATLMLSIGA